MRDGEREPVVTIPPVARTDAAHVEQPATIVTAARAQEVRGGNEIREGFVHDDDPQEAHRFQLLVRELFADEAGDFGVQLHELPSVGLGADLPGDAVVVTEEHALQDRDLGRHAIGWFEVRRAKQLLGIVANSIATLLQAGDPLFTGRAVARDREVNDAVLLAPGASRFGNRQLAAEKLLRALFSAELVDDCLELVVRTVAVL